MNHSIKFIHKILLFSLVLFSLCSSSCKEYQKNKSHQYVTNASIKKGEQLAIKYCQSCHLLPDPSLLDAVTWEEGALPAMGPLLGIFNYDFKHYPSYRNDKDIDPDYYPAKPVISTIEWQQIIDYYTALSPETLPTQVKPQIIQNNLQTFKVITPTVNYPSPAISFIKFDTTTNNHKLLLFDLATQQTLTFGSDLQLQQVLNKLNAVFVDIDFEKDKMVATDVGMINPNNAKFGKAYVLNKPGNGQIQFDTTPIFKNLARPIQITSCDLNVDQRTDYLVCEFGHLNGALSWMENTGDGKYNRHVLRAMPGAIKAIINDYNNDGLPDVWALFSQGDEGIYLFTNKGNGKFEEKQILRFPPVYGSTYFEFADFNKDGHLDIVYTCGDNADFSMILKPYHGVYIYLNDGNNNFNQLYFFPINGCYKALARDFDSDGDLDIATISFFADYANQPEEGFVYLQNDGKNNFKPYSIEATKNGRWLTMDAADLDNDGKIDLVLGNFSIRPSVTQPLKDWKKGPPFLLLKNVSR